jgi:hypothetical protein
MDIDKELKHINHEDTLAEIIKEITEHIDDIEDAILITRRSGIIYLSVSKGTMVESANYMIDLGKDYVLFAGDDEDED